MQKRPDGTTWLPWALGMPMAWDVTVPAPMLSCTYTVSQKNIPDVFSYNSRKH